MAKKLPPTKDDLVSAIDRLDNSKLSKEIVRALLINVKKLTIVTNVGTNRGRIIYVT